MISKRKLSACFSPMRFCKSDREPTVSASDVTVSLSVTVSLCRAGHAPRYASVIATPHSLQSYVCNSGSPSAWAIALANRIGLPQRRAQARAASRASPYRRHAQRPSLVRGCFCRCRTRPSGTSSAGQFSRVTSIAEQHGCDAARLGAPAAQPTTPPQNRHPDLLGRAGFPGSGACFLWLCDARTP